MELVTTLRREGGVGTLKVVIDTAHSSITVVDAPEYGKEIYDRYCTDAGFDLSQRFSFVKQAAVFDNIGEIEVYKP